MERPASRLAGPPWLGANFWSRRGGPLMWRSYDRDLVRAELDVLARHGLTVTRSFFYWPDFMPAPDRIDGAMADRYADFLDLHRELGMRTIPTFLVGHMSGENWDPAWRRGRDLYGDVWMVARQAWFAGEMVRRFGGHPAVCGWLVSNEMPLYGGEAPREVVTSWAQLMRDAVRAAGGHQPFSLGDGAWGIEITGHDSGYSVRDSAELCDFLGPHVYRMEDDVVRQHHAAAWNCELAGTFGRPVVLEEFGVSSEFVSGGNAAHYYRQALHNSLLAGATGWIAWNNTDFDDLVDQDPYRHHPFELHFGITDSDGVPKPPLAELAAFARVLEAVDFPNCRRAPADAALVVPSYLDTRYPFTEEDDRTYLYPVLRQAYVAARLADTPVALARESDGVGGDARLYLLPSVKQLLAPTWLELERLAGSGAVVYVSYCAGPNGVQRGPWYAGLDRLFGVRHRLRYGLIDPIEDAEVVFTFTRPFGDLPEGTRLAFAAAAGSAHGRAYLPVDPVDAEVLAVDGHGRPALLRRAVGQGAMLLCAYPLEYLAAATPAVNPEATSRLYDALAAEAGVRRPVTVADPRVAVDHLVHAAGRRWVWFVSQAAEELAVKPALTIPGQLRDLDESGTLTLPPYGVAVLEFVSGHTT
ncbi:MAG: cellulase family glycosylhydrolase [Mycobacteriales bacterium]